MNRPADSSTSTDAPTANLPPADTRRRAETFAGGVAVMLALTVVQRGVGFLRSLGFCRWLDADQLGQWDLSFNFLMLAAPLAVLGLPGSFGRYVDHYRQRGQLREFLLRVIGATLLLSLLGVTLFAVCGASVSRWLFGMEQPGGTSWALLLATLLVVIVFNSLTSLFSALRRYRIVSRMQLVQAVLFALLGIGFLAGIAPRAESAVAAFGLATLVASLGASYALVQVWRELPRGEAALGYSSLAVKLAPFAFWLWVTNWASNSFEMVDRWMIVHHGGFAAQEALAAVGQYHSARILPVLLIGVADLLANLLTPHLSADWEAGRRDRVRERLNFVLKLAGLGFVFVGAAMLALSPLLYHFALGHKFRAGESLLSWAILGAAWTGLTTIGCNYLWCAERSRWVSFTYALGLLVSIGGNLLLLPTWGLLGAAWSACLARGVALGALLLLARHHGMRWDPRLLSIVALPLCLPLGAIATLAAMLVVILGIGPWRGCFNESEWAEIRFRTRKKCEMIRAK